MDIQKIKTYLRQEYGEEKAIEELAPNNHISCKQRAEAGPSVHPRVQPILIHWGT